MFPPCVGVGHIHPYIETGGLFQQENTSYHRHLGCGGSIKGWYSPALHLQSFYGWTKDA